MKSSLSNMTALAMSRAPRRLWRRWSRPQASPSTRTKTPCTRCSPTRLPARQPERPTWPARALRGHRTGKREPKRCPGPLDALGPHSASVVVHDAFDNRKPNAEAVVPRAVQAMEGFEQAAPPGHSKSRCRCPVRRTPGPSDVLACPTSMCGGSDSSENLMAFAIKFVKT